MPVDTPDGERQIAITRQSTPVADVHESAAENGEALFVKVERTVQANTSLVVNDIQQGLPLPVVGELFGFASVDPHVSDSFCRVSVDLDGDGTVDAEPVVTPRIGVLTFSPALLAPPSVVIDLTLVNNGAQATDIAVQIIFRVV
jgi:hypothetical protein